MNLLDILLKQCMYDTSKKPALGYMEIVPARDAAILLLIISARVHPGTIIHSDEWAAYNGVSQFVPVSGHQTVNHSVTFVTSSII